MESKNFHRRATTRSRAAPNVTNNRLRLPRTPFVCRAPIWSVSFSKMRKLKITTAAQIVKERPACHPTTKAPADSATPSTIERVRIRRTIISSRVNLSPHRTSREYRFGTDSKSPQPPHPHLLSRPRSLCPPQRMSGRSIGRRNTLRRHRGAAERRRRALPLSPHGIRHHSLPWIHSMEWPRGISSEGSKRRQYLPGMHRCRTSSTRSGAMPITRVPVAQITTAAVSAYEPGMGVPTPSVKNIAAAMRK